MRFSTEREGGRGGELTAAEDPSEAGKDAHEDLRRRQVSSSSDQNATLATHGSDGLQTGRKTLAKVVKRARGDGKTYPDNGRQAASDEREQALDSASDSCERTRVSCGSARVMANDLTREARGDGRANDAHGEVGVERELVVD